MKQRMHASLVMGALFTILTVPCLAAEGEHFTASLPGGGEVSFVKPAGWKVSTRSAGPSITVELSPEEKGDFVVLLTILPLQADSPVSDQEGLRMAVLEMGKQRLSGALQESLELVEVRGPQAIGYVYHLTDRTPERGPGDYREATQGMILLGEHVASVTILTHSGDEATVEQAREVVKSAKFGSGP